VREGRAEGCGWDGVGATAAEADPSFTTSQRLVVTCSTRLVSEPGYIECSRTVLILGFGFAAPDVGVPENIAHLYLNQLIAGLVSS